MGMNWTQMTACFHRWAQTVLSSLASHSPMTQFRSGSMRQPPALAFTAHSPPTAFDEAEPDTISCSRQLESAGLSPWSTGGVVGLKTSM